MTAGAGGGVDFPDGQAFWVQYLQNGATVAMSNRQLVSIAVRVGPRACPLELRVTSEEALMMAEHLVRLALGLRLDAKFDWTVHYENVDDLRP